MWGFDAIGPGRNYRTYQALTDENGAVASGVGEALGVRQRFEGAENLRVTVE